MTFGDMSRHQIPGAIGALLFVTDEPVNAMTLADMLDVDLACVEEALEAVRARLSESESGIQLRQVAGGWRLYTHPQYHELIEQYVLSWDTRKLSQAAMETLAVIAYNQPITRNAIVAVRGVNSDSSINSLIEKGLVKEAGREQTPGQPILYATTRSFLEKFGLASTADLPNLEDYAPDEESRQLIRERLGVTHDPAQDQTESLFDENLSLALDFSEDSDADGQGFGRAFALAEEEGELSDSFVIPESVWSLEDHTEHEYPDGSGKEA